MPDVFHDASVGGKRQYNPVGRIPLILTDRSLQLEREQVSAARLAPTSGQVVTQFQSGSSRPDSPVRILYTQPRSPVIPLDFGAGFQAGSQARDHGARTSKKASSYRKLRHRSSRGNGAMLPKSICFVLAGLLVVVPLWILMSYGITADGRPNSPKILIGMTFCFVVGVFWLYEDLKDLLRTR
jgi:hypothetical protein